MDPVDTWLGKHDLVERIEARLAGDELLRGCQGAVDEDLTARGAVRGVSILVLAEKAYLVHAGDGAARAASACRSPWGRARRTCPRGHRRGGSLPRARLRRRRRATTWQCRWGRRPFDYGASRRFRSRKPAFPRVAWATGWHRRRYR